MLRQTRKPEACRQRPIPSGLLSGVQVDPYHRMRVAQEGTIDKAALSGPEGGPTGKSANHCPTQHTQQNAGGSGGGGEGEGGGWGVRTGQHSKMSVVLFRWGMCSQECLAGPCHCGSREA